jgi:flagellar protein FliJ
MTHNPLTTLIEMARHQADDASRRLGQLQRAQLSAQEQLAMLETYRSEYLAQLDAKMALGLGMDQLRNFRLFLDALDAAIEQQQRVGEQATQHLEGGRQAWQQSTRKLNAFDTLDDRLKRRALLAMAKKEQRDTDERAARARSGHAGLFGSGLRMEASP